MESPNPFRAIQPAVETVQSYLFKPFRFERWMIMGLLSFLMMLGGDGAIGGGGPRFGTHGPGWRGDGDSGADLERGIRHAAEWLHDHAGMIAALALAAVVAAVILSLVFQWLAAHAGFVYLDNLRRGRHEVAGPWGEYSREAHSYFWWKLLLGLAQLALLLGISAPLLLTTWRAIARTETFDPKAFFLGSGFLPLLLLWLVAIFVLAILFGIVHLFLFDYVQPIQYLRRCTVGEAAREARALIGRGWGAFLLLFVLKIGVAILGGIVAALAVCFTCCLAALPVIGQAILQPLYIFNRALTLHFLAQYGPDYRCLPEPPAAPTLPPAPPAMATIPAS